MPTSAATATLDRPVDEMHDHVLGPGDAEITLVEYGSYACAHCHAANDRITEVREEFGDRMRYVFRHRPITDSDIARRAAELAECVDDPDRFWKVHVALMSHSVTLTEDDMDAIAREFGIGDDAERRKRAQARVDADEQGARASGVTLSPTFFINGRRYDGPWDKAAFTEAMHGSLGHRMHAAALRFASWAPSTGLLLLLASVLAMLLVNSPWGDAFDEFWATRVGFAFGESHLLMSLRESINSGLLTVFFLVVGLEIKREFTVGYLATRRAAALPAAAAIGGMVIPALVYVLVLPGDSWTHGWGVPMATDTAFAIALIVMLGNRVPVQLRIFLTALAIVDDIGAIGVVAIFYSGELQVGFLAAAAATLAALALLNRSRVYRAAPYVLLGLVLWACVHAGGLHATVAGVLLALFIPTRPPPNYRALMAQANAILANEAAHGGEVFRRGPSEAALRSLDAIHDRLESPADRMLRHVGPRSSYIVLPLFAFANAGVAIETEIFEVHGTLSLAIVAGLVIGKPLGIVLACALAVWLGLATKPTAYSWQHLAGAGALAGIGFTMSLFIAAEAFPVAEDFAAAKIAVFAASTLSAMIGVALLWHAGRHIERRSEHEHRISST